MWKVGEHALAGKETLKFGSIFGSLPDFPSLHPYVKRERSQVTLFLLCVVSAEWEPWDKNKTFFFHKILHENEIRTWDCWVLSQSRQVLNQANLVNQFITHEFSCIFFFIWVRKVDLHIKMTTNTCQNDRPFVIFNLIYFGFCKES